MKPTKHSNKHLFLLKINTNRRKDQRS